MGSYTAVNRCNNQSLYASRTADAYWPIMAMNLHIYPSTFQNETRILKIIRSLKAHQIFDEIQVMALLKGALPAYESLGEGLKLSASRRSLAQLSSTGNQQTYDIVISARLRAVVLACLQMFTGISIQVVRNPAPLTLLVRLL